MVCAIIGLCFIGIILVSLFILFYNKAEKMVDNLSKTIHKFKKNRVNTKILKEEYRRYERDGVLFKVFGVGMSVEKFEELLKMISIYDTTQKTNFANCAKLKKNGKYLYEPFFEINPQDINHSGFVYVDRQFYSIGGFPTTAKPEVTILEVVIDFMYDPYDPNNSRLVEVVVLAEEKIKHFITGHYCCPDCGGDAAICDCPED